jgi:hypothetical protein
VGCGATAVDARSSRSSSCCSLAGCGVGSGHAAHRGRRAAIVDAAEAVVVALALDVELPSRPRRASSASCARWGRTAQPSSVLRAPVAPAIGDGVRRGGGRADRQGSSSSTPGSPGTLLVQRDGITVTIGSDGRSWSSMRSPPVDPGDAAPRSASSAARGASRCGAAAVGERRPVRGRPCTPIPIATVARPRHRVPRNGRWDPPLRRWPSSRLVAGGLVAFARRPGDRVGHGGARSSRRGPLAATPEDAGAGPEGRRDAAGGVGMLFVFPEPPDRPVGGVLDARHARAARHRLRRRRGRRRPSRRCSPARRGRVR